MTISDQENQRLRDRIQELESKMKGISIHSSQGISQFNLLLFMCCNIYNTSFVLPGTSSPATATPSTSTMGIQGDYF